MITQPCPMKDGTVRTICWAADHYDRDAVRLVDECCCPGCPHYKHIYDNVNDVFLSKYHRAVGVI